MTKSRILVVDDSPSILRVVEGVLSAAGYEVTTAMDGQDAMSRAKAEPPDLILLDFMMPRMNGYQVCRALAKEPDLKDIPVILMSTKGDESAERFVQQMGVVDHITKPFSPEAILAVTSYTLEKRAGEETSVAVPVVGHAAGDEATVVQPPAAATDSEEDRLRGFLLSTLQEALEQHGVRDPAAVEQAVDQALSQLPPLTGDASSGPAGRAALWGDLNLVPIPEVFQLMTLQAQTGLFQVWTRMRPTPAGATEAPRSVETRFDVYFSNGKVDFVHARNVQEEFLLGRFLVARGAIEKTELDALLRARKGGGKLLGRQLVALGHVSEEQLQAALRDQCSELVYELLRPSGGTFCLRKDARPPAEMGEVHLGLGVDELLMEGLRRVDEWGLIEKEIDNWDARLEPDPWGGVSKLTSQERFVLGLCSPEYTIRQVVQRSQMRPFDVCKILYRLIAAKQVRKLL
ncbi:MAG: response regulator [Myxococcota bacterium]